MFGALLVRHAEHALQDLVLVGRTPGISLTTRGRERARMLARALRREDVVLVQSSPRERCRETAEEICLALKLPLTIEAALDEVDFGGWTGARFAALESDADWQVWNAMRSRARPPGGESMHEVQERIFGHIAETARRATGRVVMVTHAEIVRAALLGERNLPLDDWASVVVQPGTVHDVKWARVPFDAPQIRDAAA